MAKKPFLTDIKTLRARARKHIEQGAVTAGYRADRTSSSRILAMEEQHADDLVGPLEEIAK